MNKFHKISLLHNTLIAAVLMVLFVPQLAFAQFGFIQDVLWRLVNAVFGHAAAVGGMALDYAVTEYVVGFGENFRDSGTGNSVDILWTIVRDVFNLTFIFGLVYIGLKMILRSGDSQARSALVSLILAALLVNFSLFITKFVVDFSNIAAAQIAGAFMREGTYQISGSFMNIMGVTDVFNSRGSLDNIARGSAGLTFIFGTMFLYIILAFVFLAGGIMLIIRYVVLIIYMILSPVMFLGWVFPGFAGASKDFWNKFLTRAFFAPAYLLMLYFSNQILVNMRGANDINAGSISQAFSGQAGPSSGSFAAVFPFFFMAAGFLIASLVVAQKMGSVGASTAISVGKRAANRGRQLAVGGTANMARYGLDRAAAMDPNKKTPAVLRPFRSLTRATARGLNVVGVRDGLDTAAKPWTSLGEARKKREAAQAGRDSAARQQDTVAAGMAAQTELEKLNNLTGPLTADQLARKKALEDTVDKMAQTVSTMSTKMFEEMTEKQLESVSEYMTNSQVESVMKSDNMTDAQKGLITKKRQESIEKILTTSGGSLAEEVTKLSIEQIETMGESWINDNVKHFSKSQMDDLKKSKKFTENRRNSFAAKRKADYAATMATGRPNDIATLFETSPAVGTTPAKRKKPVEVANLGADVLLSPSSLGFLEPADLEAIASKETLTQPERATLRGMIDSSRYMGANKTRLQAYFSSSHGARHW